MFEIMQSIWLPHGNVNYSRSYISYRSGTYLPWNCIDPAEIGDLPGSVRYYSAVGGASPCLYLWARGCREMVDSADRRAEVVKMVVVRLARLFLRVAGDASNFALVLRNAPSVNLTGSLVSSQQMSRYIVRGMCYQRTTLSGNVRGILILDRYAVGLVFVCVLVVFARLAGRLSRSGPNNTTNSTGSRTVSRSRYTTALNYFFNVKAM